MKMSRYLFIENNLSYLHTSNKKLLTRDVGPRGVLNVKANKILKIQEDRVKRIELIGDPEVREAHVEKGCAENATQNTQSPESGLVSQRLGRIE